MVSRSFPERVARAGGVIFAFLIQDDNSNAPHASRFPPLQQVIAARDSAFGLLMFNHFSNGVDPITTHW